MKKPKTSLPVKVGDKDFYNINGNVVYGVEIVSTNPDTPYKYMTIVESDPDPSAEDVHAQLHDAEYIVEACNLYPEFIELLERIESESNDKTVGRKIREFMTNKGIW